MRQSSSATRVSVGNNNDFRSCDRVLSFDVVVQKDDTVDSIAAKLGLPRDVLLSANGGPSCSSVLPMRPGKANNWPSFYHCAHATLLIEATL